MKKLLIPALASALVLGTASTSLAAQNPFSDVNEHHWAYNSIIELAETGIITGYDNSDASLNGKFVGGRNITRYEMAQMIAKALARIEGETSPFNVQLVGHQWTFVDNSGVRRVVDGTVTPFQLSGGGTVNQKQLDDLMNLMIEFRSELDTLGIRVQDLEDHSDMVTWTGELLYRYWNDKTDDEDERTTINNMSLRFFPEAYLNENWTAKARFTAELDLADDTTSNVALTYIYADGNYGKFNINLGKMILFSNVDKGLVVDDFFSGGRVTYGDKFKVMVEGGRWNLNNSVLGLDDKSSYLGAELLYDDEERFNFGLGYRYFKSKEFANADGYGDKDKANIFSVGAGYKFGDFELAAAYAKNNKADEYNKAYNIELDYAGADPEEVNSWGALVAYRYIGDNAALVTTYDTFGVTSNKKGVEVGLGWTPFKNIVAQVNYFHGKTLANNEKNRTLFGNVTFTF